MQRAIKDQEKSADANATSGAGTPSTFANSPSSPISATAAALAAIAAASGTNENNGKYSNFKPGGNGGVESPTSPNGAGLPKKVQILFMERSIQESQVVSDYTQRLEKFRAAWTEAEKVREESVLEEREKHANNLKKHHEDINMIIDAINALNIPNLPQLPHSDEASSAPDDVQLSKYKAESRSRTSSTNLVPVEDILSLYSANIVIESRDVQLRFDRLTRNYELALEADKQERSRFTKALEDIEKNLEKEKLSISSSAREVKDKFRRVLDESRKTTAREIIQAFSLSSEKD